MARNVRHCGGVSARIRPCRLRHARLPGGVQFPFQRCRQRRYQSSSSLGSARKRQRIDKNTHVETSAQVRFAPPGCSNSANCSPIKSPPGVLQPEFCLNPFDGSTAMAAAAAAACGCQWLFQAWMEAPSVASALFVMALRLPRLKFVIVTWGEEGCIMLEKNMQAIFSMTVRGSTEGENIDVNIVVASLQKKAKEMSSILPISVSSEVGSLEAQQKNLVGIVEAIAPPELVDNTGAGDGFTGAILYGI